MHFAAPARIAQTSLRARPPWAICTLHRSFRPKRKGRFHGSDPAGRENKASPGRLDARTAGGASR